MLTEARIRDEFEGVEGLDWISALRGPAIKKLVENKDFSMSLFDDRDMAEITSPDFPGERLMVCRNPLLADDRRWTREEQLEATEKVLASISKATRRKKRPLRGKKDIALRVGETVNKYKMGKHFNLTITSANFKYERKSVPCWQIWPRSQKIKSSRTFPMRLLSQRSHGLRKRRRKPSIGSRYFCSVPSMRLA